MAVLDFDGDQTITGTFSDTIEQALVGCGHSVVDRQRLHTTLRERKDSDIDYRRLGKLLGAELFIRGSLVKEHSFLAGDLVTQSTLKGIDAQTGEVIFTRVYDGSLSGTDTPINAGRVQGKKLCELLGK